eukprot:7989153-Lingulodinium_polyedra.AAC.1
MPLSSAGRASREATLRPRQASRCPAAAGCRLRPWWTLQTTCQQKLPTQRRCRRRFWSRSPSRLP